MFIFTVGWNELVFYFDNHLTHTRDEEARNGNRKSKQRWEEKSLNLKRKVLTEILEKLDKYLDFGHGGERAERGRETLQQGKDWLKRRCFEHFMNF